MNNILDGNLFISKVLEVPGVMDLLPDDLKEFAIDFMEKRRDQIKKREEEFRKLEEENKRLREEEERKRKEKYDELLCIGTWGEKVPLNERFVLCEKFRKAHNETVYCAIDLVRGYMAPYWGYWGGTGDLCSPFYREAVKKIFELRDDKIGLAKEIEHRWNFFKITNHKDDCDEPFYVLKYTTDSDDTVIITGRSEKLPYSEHLKRLKEKYDNKSDV